MKEKLNKFRMWIVFKILGDRPLIHNVTFYQTVCIDTESGVTLNNVNVELGHKRPWVSKDDGIGFKFDYYKASINGEYDKIIERNLNCKF